MTALTDGWVTKPLAGVGLGVIPVEIDLATCPHCGMRWYVGNLPPSDHAAGRVLIHCLPYYGGCDSPFHMETSRVY